MVKSTPSSPKVSTIVVRKPSAGSAIKLNSASATANAFSKFNASSFYTSPTSGSLNGKCWYY